jgi:glycosyltransferase involved in cell wall biosynthesis
MDAFVLPSRSETWGLVLNEAMLFDLPVLASSMVGAGVDLVHDGTNGYLFEVGNVRQLTDALRTLVVSSEPRSRFGQRSRAIVEQYTHQACVRGILDGLRYVTGRTRLDPHRLESRGTTA